MALIKNLSEIKDLEPVEGGVEYDLRIIKAKAINSARTGRNGVLFIIDILDHDNALNLMHNIWFGNDGTYTADEEEKSDNMWRMVKEFIRAIGLDPEMDLEADDFTDVEFSAILEYDDGINPETNTQDFAPKNVLGRIIG